MLHRRWSLSTRLTAVRHEAKQLRATGRAKRGDIRVEYDLLRRTRFSIRFGKLNHCTMNDNDTTGAKCIEDAIVPDGHRGPLLDRCQPSRCANSVLAPEHLPIWTAEHASLTRLLSDPKLPSNRRALLDVQLQEVDLGEPRHTDGRLTKDSLWREAGVSRATMNRATEILAGWDAPAADSPAGTMQHQHNHEITEPRGRLRRSRAECRRLEDHVDAAATVITTLLAENVALREQAARRSAAVVPLSRSHAVRD